MWWAILNISAKMWGGHPPRPFQILRFAFAHRSESISSNSINVLSRIDLQEVAVSRVSWCFLDFQTQDVFSGVYGA